MNRELMENDADETPVFYQIKQTDKKMVSIMDKAMNEG